MQIYNEFRVIDYQPDIGHLVLGWYDDQQPLAGQVILQRAHKIPIEAEQNNWTRAQLLTFWLLEVEDIADIPQWAKDEAHKTRVEFVLTPIVLP